MRTSPSRRLASKAGFTLLEMLIVLALMGLLVAIAVPNMKRLMSWSTVQTTFFDFQRQLTTLRSLAYTENRALMVVSTGETVDDSASEFTAYALTFDDPAWRYQFSEPLMISSGGVCSEVGVQIFQDRDLALNLESRPDCRFLQVR